MLDTQQKRASALNMTMPFRLGRAVPNAFIDLDDRLALLGMYSRVKISFDRTSNSGYQAASSSYSWSHTCAGGRGYLVVSVALLSAIGNSVTALTYNGVSLVLIDIKASSTGAVRTEMWGMVNPPAGSHTIAVTLNAATITAAIATSWAGINQATPTEAFNGATATNIGAADATVDVTTVADQDYVLDIVATDDTAITAASDQVSRANVTGAAASVACSTHNVPVSPAGTITQSYTDVGAGATWVIAALGLIPAGENTVYFLGASGSITPAGNLIRQPNKILSGISSPAGTLIEMAIKALAGSIAPSGVIIKQINTSYTGQMTPGGEIDNQAQTRLAGSIAPVGILIRQVSKILAGTLSLTGNLIKQAQINLSGSITPGGALDNLKVIVLLLSGSIAPTGTLVRQINKILDGTIAPAGGLIRQVQTQLSGIITPLGSLINIFIPGGAAIGVATKFKGMFRGMFKRML